MKIVKTKCDNPGCHEVSTPEMEKPYVSPYGWVTIKCNLVGTGPHVTIETCSTACVEAALDAAIDEAMRKEQDR